MKAMAESTEQQRKQGFSLVEVLVALAMSAVIGLALLSLFAQSVKSKQSGDSLSQTIENGRYALDWLSAEASLAGYYGSLSPSSAAIWVAPTTSEICAPTVANLAFAAPTTAGGAETLPVAVQGFNGSSSSPLSCLPNYRAGSDVVLIRRVSTEPLTSQPCLGASPCTDPRATVPTGNGVMYLQSSGWQDWGCSYRAESDPAPFVFNVRGTAANPGPFVLHSAACPNPSEPSNPPAARADVRALIVRAYYVADCNNCAAADGVPSLKYAEMRHDGTSFVMNSGPVTVTPGIETMHLEYGVDDSPASPDGAVDAYATASTVTAGNDWPNVVAIRVALVARALNRTAGHNDARTYDLGSVGTVSYTPATADSSFERRVFMSTVSLNNIIGRRER